MNDKIRLLLKYIKDRFPNGCDDGTRTCDTSCPLYGFDKGSFEDDLCELLCNQESRTRDEYVHYDEG